MMIFCSFFSFTLILSLDFTLSAANSKVSNATEISLQASKSFRQHEDKPLQNEHIDYAMRRTNQQFKKKQLNLLPNSKGNVKDFEKRGWFCLTCDSSKYDSDLDLGEVPLEYDPRSGLYLAVVEIGTPKQKFRLLVDTGSSALWVTGVNCLVRDENVPRYNARASSTSKSITGYFQESYGIYKSTIDGLEVGGVKYKDSVTIGGLTIRNHHFGVAEVKTKLMVDATFDGIIGLSFGISSFTNDLDSFFHYLMIKRTIKWFIFGLYLSREHLGEFSNSKLIFGSYDQNKAPNLNWNHLVNSPYWMINIDAVIVNDQEINLTNKEAIIDVGAPYIHADPTQIENINAAIPGSTHNFRYPCNSSPSITFIINGEKYPIDPRDLKRIETSSQVDNILNEPMCIGPFEPLRNSDHWVLGVTFLRNVYTVFDFTNAQIGFYSLTERKV